MTRTLAHEAHPVKSNFVKLPGGATLNSCEDLLARLLVPVDVTALSTAAAELEE